jgi:LacI family transcriptional regulator
LAIRQCADRRRGAYHAVIRAGLDPAAVLTEISVLAMNTPCGAEAADKIRAAGPYGPGVPTAAFCTNDLLALGLLRRLSQLGAQVPGDLAIVGYDDIDFAAERALRLASSQMETDLRPGHPLDNGASGLVPGPRPAREP